MDATPQATYSYFRNSIFLDVLVIWSGFFLLYVIFPLAKKRPRTRLSIGTLECRDR